jgi:putative acetyltransferase
MLEVRPERPGDMPGIRAVLTSAFGGPAEAGLVDALRGGSAWLPSLSMVAVREQTVIAYALLSRIVVAGDADVPALALGPVGVRRDVQRQGLGTAVVRSALAGASGERLVIVLGDPRYYRRFGFVPAASLGVTGPWRSFGEAWQALLLDGSRPAPGEALYPDAWDQL